MVDLNLRIELLHELLERANGQLTLDDRREAQIILAGLDQDQKQRVAQAYNEADWDNAGYVSVILGLSFPDADFSRKMKENTPVSELLYNFRNRTSKKLIPARQELLRRYEHLDPKDQLDFRMALLSSPTASDNVTGCKYCMDRWNGEELPPVESIMHNAHETANYNAWYWSCRVLLRYAPTDFLLKNQNNLTHFRSEDVKSLYYYLALRLYQEPSFVLKKENLRVGDYYRIVFYSGASLNDDEWLEDFFRAMAEIYIFSAHYFPQNRSRTPTQPEVPRRWTKVGEFIPLPSWFKDKPRNAVSLTHMSSLHTMLLYGAQMGCEKIGVAMQYLHEVEDKMIEEAKGASDPDIYWWPYEWSREQWLYAKSKIVIPCVEQLRTCCPTEFLYCFDERIEEYEKWLAPFVELAKREHYEHFLPPSHSGYYPAPAKTFSKSDLAESPVLRHLKESLGLVQVDNI